MRSTSEHGVKKNALRLLWLQGVFLSKSVDFSKFGGIIILNNRDFKGGFFYELSLNRRYDNYDDTYSNQFNFLVR